MASGGDDHSVRIGGDATGLQIVTGDGNDAVMKGVKVELPPAETVDPQAWLADVLARIASTPMARLGELLPWSWAAEPQTVEAA